MNASSENDARLRAIGQRQLGLVTVAQAERAGVDRAALARRCASGALVPVFTGVFRLAAVAPTPEQQILAGALSRPGSIITATSAATVHALPAAERAGWKQVAPIVAVRFGRSDRTSGIHVVRHTFDLPSRPWMTARVATPAATLLFLPRYVDVAVVERCLDHCLAHRLTTVAEVSRLLGSVPSRAVHGRARLTELLKERTAGIGHRSGLEQQVGRWLNDAGLQGWLPNVRVPVGGAQRVEVDFAWPAQKVALEISPFFTHGAEAAQARDVQRRRLLVSAGWRVAEATDSDLVSRLAFGSVVVTLAGLIGDQSPAFLRAV